MNEFSLALDDDQQQLQKWVHEFAAEVVRPAAHEWDEREEFPMPIVQEAARIGLYSWEFAANANLTAAAYAEAETLHAEGGPVPSIDDGA